MRTERLQAADLWQAWHFGSGVGAFNGLGAAVDFDCGTGPVEPVSLSNSIDVQVQRQLIGLLRLSSVVIAELVGMRHAPRSRYWCR